jgi:hypothetical protein
MEDLLFFPAWMLALLPQVIALLKQWVPQLWREILAAVMAAVATAYVIVTTDLTLIPGVQEGFILFLLLTGSRAAVTGVVNTVKATSKQVPLVADRDTVKALTVGAVALLFVAAFVGRAWAQDSTLVAPVVETAKETGRLWLLLGSQFFAKFLDWAFSRIGR